MNQYRSKTILLFSHIVFVFLLLSCGNNPKSVHWPLPERELKSLEKSIKGAKKYGDLAEAKADSIKQKLQEKKLSICNRVRVMEEVADFYRPRMADSALTYANYAYVLSKKSNDSICIESAHLTLTDALSAAGYFSAAVAVFDSIPHGGLTPENKIHYWQTGRQLYSNMCNYIGEGGRLYDLYQEKENIYVDSLLRFLPDYNDFKIFLKSQQLITAGRYETARQMLEPMLQRVPKGSQIYGMTAYQIAATYKTSDQTHYAAFLSKAAESDIIGGIRDGYALPALSKWIFTQGSYKLAFDFINFAMNDAYRGSARMRLVNISSMVPEIDNAYRNQIDSSLSDFALYAIMVSIILIAVILVLVLLIREMRKRRLAHSELAQVSKMKDSYIRDFIGLCSAYSEKYDSLAKTVTRKITAGQSQDLLKLVKSGKASEDENEEFYLTIDRVFMSLYPHFIEQINNLLLPDQRFDVGKNVTSLNPELRVYGFVRLGVTESAKIAKILNYSPNTVYSYRNRMRNKAINHEGFDEEVMNLDNEETGSVLENMI